jgi:hypothetical protein
MNIDPFKSFDPCLLTQADQSDGRSYRRIQMEQCARMTALNLFGSGDLRFLTSQTLFPVIIERVCDAFGLCAKDIMSPTPHAENGFNATLSFHATRFVAEAGKYQSPRRSTDLSEDLLQQSSHALLEHLPTALKLRWLAFRLYGADTTALGRAVLAYPSHRLKNNNEWRQHASTLRAHAAKHTFERGYEKLKQEAMFPLADLWTTAASKCFLIGVAAETEFFEPAMADVQKSAYRLSDPQHYAAPEEPDNLPKRIKHPILNQFERRYPVAAYSQAELGLSLHSIVKRGRGIVLEARPQNDLLEGTYVRVRFSAIRPNQFFAYQKQGWGPFARRVLKPMSSNP